MPTIRITDECMSAIRANARAPFNQTATRNPDGTWNVPVEDDTLERLKEHQFVGESISDVIMRAFASQGKPN